MKKAIAVGVIGLAGILAFAATERVQSLNANTGLWQTSLTVNYTGLPAGMAAAVNPAMTYKTCVKPEDLNTDVWLSGNGAGLKCASWNVLKSTDTDEEMEGKSCDAGNGMTADGHGTIHLSDPGHLTGSIDATFNGVTGNGNAVQMHASYTSTWIGATCPANMK